MEAQKRDDSVQELVLFHVLGTQCALDSKFVVEIIQELDIAHLPGSEPFINGIANLRGQIVTAIDLPKKLGFENWKSPLNKIIIVEIEEEKLGLCVEDVDDVISVSRKNFHKPSQNFLGLDMKVFPLSYCENDMLIPIIHLDCLN